MKIPRKANWNRPSTREYAAVRCGISTQRIRVELTQENCCVFFMRSRQLRYTRPRSAFGVWPRNRRRNFSLLRATRLVQQLLKSNRILLHCSGVCNAYTPPYTGTVRTWKIKCRTRAIWIYNTLAELRTRLQNTSRRPSYELRPQKSKHGVGCYWHDVWPSQGCARWLKRYDDDTDRVWIVQKREKRKKNIRRGVRVKMGKKNRKSIYTACRDTSVRRMYLVHVIWMSRVHDNALGVAQTYRTTPSYKTRTDVEKEKEL